MAASQPILIEIPRSGFGDLAALAEHADRLQAAASIIAQCASPSDLDDVAEQLGTKLHLEPRAASGILAGLSTMRSLIDRYSLTGQQVVTSLTGSMDVQASETWTARYRDLWNKAIPSIVAAIDAIPAESCLSIQRKVKELTYAHQNIFTDASLLTDLRPVYNASGDQIHAAVLTHVLSVSYQNGTRRGSIEFAMDSSDIAKLFQLVERAQAKTETAKKFFKAGSSLPVIVAGESRTDSEASQ